MSIFIIIFKNTKGFLVQLENDNTFKIKNVNDILVLQVN